MSETLITETRRGNEVTYLRNVGLSTGTQIKTVIKPKTAIVKVKNHDYFVIYDSRMNVWKEAFHYLNFGIKDNTSKNTKVHHMEALKFLKAFEEIIDKSLKDFKLEDVNTLKDFLSGNFSHLKGSDFTLHLSSQRCIATINGYLSIYRCFLSYLGCEDNILFKVKPTRQWRDDNEYKPQHNDKYLTNERLPKQEIEVPEYITIDQYIKIRRLIRHKYTLREECIVRLMYERALRIGEILGTTSDDLLTIKDNNGEYIHVLQIRNRVTDRGDQLAKGCINVTSKEQYKTSEYNTKGISGAGYQEVILDKDIFDSINEYVENAHTKATSTKAGRERYKKYTIADRVKPSKNPYEDPNFYLFLNNIGTPLSQDSWNRTLKAIFRECDIPLDKGKKKHNLSHRFRHGFAMVHVQILKTPQLILSKEMRHASIFSSSPYITPTLSQQVKLQTEFADKLRELVPSFDKLQGESDD